MATTQRKPLLCHFCDRPFQVYLVIDKFSPFYSVELRVCKICSKNAQHGRSLGGRSQKFSSSGASGIHLLRNCIDLARLFHKYALAKFLKNHHPKATKRRSKKEIRAYKENRRLLLDIPKPEIPDDLIAVPAGTTVEIKKNGDRQFRPHVTEKTIHMHKTGRAGDVITGRFLAYQIRLSINHQIQDDSQKTGSVARMAF